MKQDYKVTFCDGFTGAEMNNILVHEARNEAEAIEKGIVILADNSWDADGTDWEDYYRSLDAKVEIVK